MSRPRPESTLITPQVLRKWRLPEPTGGKEARGSILVVGASTETLGAVLLAAEAALRSGAGKLQVAVPVSVAGFAAQASAMLLGPGMTDVEQTRQLVEALLTGFDGPVALDALGLAAITANSSCLHHLAGRAVLTPNPTELALSLHLEPADIEADPAGAALQLAAQAKAAVGLGGATSWIATPDGELWEDQSGGAGLGVSGSGDVRAGVVAGLLARGAEPAQAAVWAAHLHGRAGERLAARVGRLGFLARELPPEIPRVLAEVDL
jgi:ADP-dependent NAD(P)H-hydrate dehydratase